MRILDKTVTREPWAQLTPEQRNELTGAGNIAPWMFKQSVVLTVVNGDQVCQLDGTVEQAARPAEVEPKPTIGERVRAMFAKSGGE